MSFEDARRAISEAKHHAKAKAAAMLQTSNKTWSDKLAAARAEQQWLQDQLQDMMQQREQLAQEVRLSACMQSQQTQDFDPGALYCRSTTMHVCVRKTVGNIRQCSPVCNLCAMHHMLYFLVVCNGVVQCC